MEWGWLRKMGIFLIEQDQDSHSDSKVYRNIWLLQRKKTIKEHVMVYNAIQSCCWDLKLEGECWKFVNWSMFLHTCEAFPAFSSCFQINSPELHLSVTMSLCFLLTNLSARQLQWKWDHGWPQLQPIIDILFSLTISPPISPPTLFTCFLMKGLRPETLTLTCWLFWHFLFKSQSVFVT